MVGYSSTAQQATLKSALRPHSPTAVATNPQEHGSTQKGAPQALFTRATNFHAALTQTSRYTTATPHTVIHLHGRYLHSHANLPSGSSCSGWSLTGQRAHDSFRHATNAPREQLVFFICMYKTRVPTPPRSRPLPAPPQRFGQGRHDNYRFTSTSLARNAKPRHTTPLVAQPTVSIDRPIGQQDSTLQAMARSTSSTSPFLKA